MVDDGPQLCLTRAVVVKSETVESHPSQDVDEHLVVTDVLFDIIDGRRGILDVLDDLAEPE